MAIRIISKEELDKILEQHKLWASGKAGGKRADLREAYLHGANLHGANLIEASLIKADLEGTNLSGANLSGANLYGADLREVNLREADLSGADLRGANLLGANLFGANLLGADLFGANLRGAIYNESQLTNAINVSIRWTRKEINERKVSNQEIEELREENKQLSERAKALEQEREQGKINEEEYKLQNEGLSNDNQILNQRLKEAEEKERREITKENIDKAIDALKNPNTYIKKQIDIQNILAIVYGVIGLASFVVMIWYMFNKYSVFDSTDLEKTNLISWLLYVSPILLLGSLVVTLINQVNLRLKRILVLNERKRYVEAMGGALKATVELTETDVDARVKIEKYMDTIVKNTISREIDISNLDASESEEVKSLELLNKIKDLLKK